MSGQGWAGSRRGMDPGQSGGGEWGRKLVLWAEASACAKALELGSRRCSRNDFREGQHLSRIYCVWAPSYDPYSSLLNPCRHQTVHRTALFPCGDELTGTERFSDSPGGTQAWGGWPGLHVAGVRGGA